MMTAPVWENSKSFEQHLKDMRMFRWLHYRNMEVDFSVQKNRPTLYGTYIPKASGRNNSLICTIGKKPLIKIWDIVPPGNSQN